MSETEIDNDFEHINFTPRDVIGYSFEVLISKLLGRYGIGYNSNPLGSIIEWKKHQGKGVDFKIPELNVELEAKSGYARIYRSWILRDWIPRFSYHNEIRIVIVKPTLKLSDKCLELLFNYGINVVYPDSISYIVKEGNKLIEANSTKKTVKNTSAQKNGTKNISKNTSVEKNGIENDGARTEQNTQSSTSREYTVSPISVGTEKCSSFDSTSDNISVEREKFLNETLSRYPLLKQNKIKSPKECPNRKYRIVVCSLKMLNPSYVCIFRVLYHIRHNNFPPHIERRGKIYICKNPKCTGEVCKTLDLTCSFLVGINKCPRMYKPPHFCLPLPKPKILPSPDLTYYLNLQRDESKMKCKQIGDSNGGTQGTS